MATLEGSEVALWKVKSVGDNPRTWTNKHKKEMVSYRIAVETADGSEQPPKGQKSYSKVELVQVPATAAPKPGDQLDGSIEVRKYGENNEKEDLKFTKTQQGRGGGGRSYKPRPDDAPPVYAERQAKIAAQHSQDMALRVLELAAQTNDDPVSIMERLGVETEHDGKTLGLVAAFSRQVNMAGAGAWNSEEEHGRIAGALAKIGG